MNAADQNYSLMAITTRDCMNVHHSFWSNNQAMTTEMEKLESVLTQIDSFSKETTISTINVTQDKVRAKSDAIASTLKITGPACVYALDKSNTSLHDKLNVSKGLLNKMQDSVLPQRLTRIVKIISSIGSELLLYGISKEDIRTAKAKTKVYTSIVDNPKKLIAERSSKNKTVSILIDELRDIFYRLDKLMRIYIDTDFYSEYRKARKIVDRSKKTETKPEK